MHTDGHGFCCLDSLHRQHRLAAFVPGEQSRPDPTPFREAEFQACAQAAETVLDAAAQIDGGGFGEILRRAAYLGDGEGLFSDHVIRLQFSRVLEASVLNR